MTYWRETVAAFVSFFLLIALPLPSAHATASITDVRLDNSNPKIGESINWLVDVDCAGVPIQQVLISVLDPVGVLSYSYNSYIDIKSGTIGSRSTIKIPFKITEEASAGRYSVQSVSMTCQNKFGGSYQWSGPLSDISFDLISGSAAPALTQPKIEKLELVSGTTVKVGEKIRILVSALGTGKLNNVNISLMSPNGSEIQKNFNQYGQTPSGEASKRIETTFEFAVDEDWVPGSYKISSLEISGYAGIDLSNPDPDDPNPRNTTSSFERSVRLTLSSGVESIGGSPASGMEAQPSLKNFSVTVDNPNPTEALPPVVTQITLPQDSTSAGEIFELSLGIDAKNAYIYNAYATFSLSDNLSQTFGCSAEGLRKSPQQKIIENLLMKCQTQRVNSAGNYVLRYISVNSTTCNIAPDVLYSQEHQSCTQAPRTRNSNFHYSLNSGYVNSIPVPKKNLTNILDGTQIVKLTAPAPLQSPKYTSVAIESTQVKIFYPWTYEYFCDYTSSQGKVSSGTNDKIYNVVAITELKPYSKVVLAGTCTALDKSKVSFTETFTTALPKAPILPSVTSQESDYNSVKILLSDLDQEGVEYDAQLTVGSLTILGNTLEISDLEPGETSVLTMTMTDQFGQSAAGIVGTFKALDPPKLIAPKVTLVKSSKGSYTFTFKRLKELTYSVKATNCTARLSGENIFVSRLVPNKLAVAYLHVSDMYGQKVSVKFLTASVKKN
jgi:hypothetical protein